MCRWAARPRMGCCTSPECKVPEHAPCSAGDRLSASRCVAHAVVGLVEDGTADAHKLGLRDAVMQMCHGWDTQHHQVTRLGRLREALPCLQAGVADLHDLVGERDVRPNQDIDIMRVDLRLRHGCEPRRWPAQSAHPAHCRHRTERRLRRNLPAGSSTNFGPPPGYGRSGVSPV